MDIEEDPKETSTSQFSLESLMVLSKEELCHIILKNQTSKESVSLKRSLPDSASTEQGPARKVKKRKVKETKRKEKQKRKEKIIIFSDFFLLFSCSPLSHYFSHLF